MLGYRLCVLSRLRIPHPDLLQEAFTYEQWNGWHRFYAEDPWGDVRADMRAGANTIIDKYGGEDMTFVYPYSRNADSLPERIKAMEDRTAAAQKDEALQAKLKRAREMHRAAKAQKDGSQ